MTCTKEIKGGYNLRFWQNVLLCIHYLETPKWDPPPPPPHIVRGCLVWSCPISIVSLIGSIGGRNNYRGSRLLKKDVRLEAFFLRILVRGSCQTILNQAEHGRLRVLARSKDPLLQTQPLIANTGGAADIQSHQTCQLLVNTTVTNVIA